MEQTCSKTCGKCKRYKKDCDFSHECECETFVACGQFEERLDLINENRFEEEREFVNDLTREMDKHLTPPSKKMLEHIGDGTYLCVKDRGVYPIRFPGSTRGHISVDENNCITGVHLYDTACDNCVAVYEQSVKGIFDKYIGMKIVYRAYVGCIGSGASGKVTILSNEMLNTQPQFADDKKAIKDFAKLSAFASLLGVDVIPELSHIGICKFENDHKCSYFKRSCQRYGCKKFESERD